MAFTEWILNGRDLHHLKVLILDHNFSNRTKHRLKVIENLTIILEAFPIEKLSLVGGPDEKTALRADLVPLILSLTNNVSLSELNMTGNLAGDSLAFAIAKVIQVNRVLTSIDLDRNNLTILGLKRLHQALERNTTLLKMPLPYVDLNNLAERLTEKTLPELQKLLSQIQMRLALNNGRIGKPKEIAVSSQLTAEVIADYNATDPRVLSLQKGKMVKIISIVSKEWWKVEYESQIGLAPANHLRLPSQKKQKRQVSKSESTRIDLDQKLKVPKMDDDTRIGIQEGRGVLKTTGILDEKGTVKGIHEKKEKEAQQKSFENKFEGLQME